jgi:hypothetical protein
MWRKWLGDKARIIGVDLNPEAKKWEADGFEIYIGDQGSAEFWQELFRVVGPFDALLDDGGHQSHQQIVTLNEALRAASGRCVIVIEDTCTSVMKEFSGHGRHSFLEYSKASTDVLITKNVHFYPGEFPKIRNEDVVQRFASVYSVSFYPGIVAYKINTNESHMPSLIWNTPPVANAASDFRYNGSTSTTVQWPDPFVKKSVVIEGGVR